jgi:hypothetical protein
MSISLEGIASNIEGEERGLAYLNVEHNGQTYAWQIFVPPNSDLADYLASKEASIYADIDAKEAAWAALTPKTRVIANPMYDDSVTIDPITVDIDKSEIVRPDIPDYYAKRRAEYPSLAEQLGAMWKGGDAVAEMAAKIEAVKAKYPKT